METTRDQYLRLDDRALLHQCDVDTYRASGPGGQKRNKTDSAVRLRHRPTGLTAIAVESRSQHENRAKALRRLRRTIALTIRIHVDPDHYEPRPEVAECRSKAGRFQIGFKNQRYDHVLAEILDLLHACKGQVSTAAERLGISTANLVNWISKDDKLRAAVNEIRADNNIAPLR